MTDNFCIDELDAESIKNNLPNNLKAEEIIVYEVVDSTNNVAKDKAKSGAKSGTIILAKEQTAGKGRLGRSFYSPKNTGLYMSIILRPTLDIDCSLLITSAAAVAVCRAIDKIYETHTQIKWVNDVYLNDKKICGILTEASTKANSIPPQLDYIILGIGINITTDDFPDNINQVATSIKSKSQKSCCVNALAANLLTEIFAVLDELQSHGFMQDYRNRSCIIGQDVDVITPQGKYMATAIDINENCHLIIKMPNGDISELSTGEASIRRHFA